MRHTRSPIPCRFPRRTARGLGLLDAVLAAAILSSLALWGGQMAGSWLERRLLAGETRALAGLARAGRLWAERGAATMPTAGTPPVAVTHAQLRGAGLWWPDRPAGAAAGVIATTPGRRRAMELFLYVPPGTSDRVMVIARARGAAGEPAPPGIPGAADGVVAVGVIAPDGTTLRGPDVAFGFTTGNGFAQSFAQEGDLFALAHVWTQARCLHLQRRPDAVTGCTGGNRMDIPLDMGGNTITGLGGITGNLEVTGTFEADDMKVGGTLEAEGLEVDNARMGTVAASTGRFDTLAVDTLVVNNCTGCQ